MNEHIARALELAQNQKRNIVEMMVSVVDSNKAPIKNEDGTTYEIPLHICVDAMSAEVLLEHGEDFTALMNIASTIVSERSTKPVKKKTEEEMFLENFGELTKLMQGSAGNRIIAASIVNFDYKKELLDVGLDLSIISKSNILGMALGAMQNDMSRFPSNRETARKQGRKNANGNNVQKISEGTK